MPPKKRQRLITPANPGIIRQHLLDKYSNIPVDSSCFLKGHALFIFVVRADRSRAKAKRELSVYVPSTSQHEDHIDTTLRHIDATLKQTLSQTLYRFTKPANTKQFENFTMVCKEPFPLIPDVDIVDKEMPMEPVSNIVDVVHTPFDTPTVLKSPVKTRQILKCSNCKRLRNSIKLLRQKNQEMQKDKLDRIKNINRNQNRKYSVKLLNQAIKRKNSQIKKLRECLHDSDEYKDEQSAKEQAFTLNKKLLQVKMYHKMNKRPSQSHTACEKEIQALKFKCQQKDSEIASLVEEKTLLEEKILEMEGRTKRTKVGRKCYNADMRMVVYDAIVNQVPMANIPHLIRRFAVRCGITLSDIPQRTSVEKMARELGSVADLQTAEAILENKNSTLGFDATTLEGDHLNSIHFTTQTDCFVAAIDKLPGGTAEDYSSHIQDTIDNLSSVHAYFMDGDQQVSKEKIIANIANTLTDRCAANHAAILLVEQAWSKSLNELNCHLHPLDSIATKARSALKNCELDLPGPARGLWGRDCIAANVVLAMNKMRYKDGKGDPRGFVTFLEDNNLPRGILPRYRGNRLHVLFHICGVFIQYHGKFYEFLKKGNSCGGLRGSILNDFTSEVGQLEMHVLGLLGKLLTGPWMKKFYRDADSQFDHVEGIAMVKDVTHRLRVVEDPLDLLKSRTDFFGDLLDVSDPSLLVFRKQPNNP